jgi:hypothetical protein
MRTRPRPLSWLTGLLCGLLPACHGSPGEPRPSVQAATDDVGGEWSQEVQGVRGRLIAIPAKAGDGGRQLRIDVELKNVSDVADPIEIWWTDIQSVVTFSLEDEAGRELPESSLGGNHISPLGHWLRLEPHSLTRMTITTAAYEYVRRGETLLRPVTFQGWDLSAAPTGKLYLRAKLAPDAAEGPVPRRNWKGPLELPRVALP